ncbi:MAG: peptidylprolyl isomerase, partial [Caulobacteraceae bacterium]
RHILFQVTPGAPVNHLRAYAERTLMAILAEPETFAAKARELSNCPSGALDGSLGQIARGDCAPEFDAAIFADVSIGVLPSLVKTRFGFHIVAVDRRVAGRIVPFDAVREKVAERLTSRVQRRALAQYIALLAGEAQIEGVDLVQASSPLLQ